MFYASFVRWWGIEGWQSPFHPEGSQETPSAGTVASFAGGVLTPTLSDGSTVKGLVNEQTEIECGSALPSAHAADHGDGQQGDDGSESGQQPGEHGNEDEGGEQGEDEGGQASSCGPAALQPTTPVREAELHIGPEGAVFERIALAG